MRKRLLYAWIESFKNLTKIGIPLVDDYQFIYDESGQSLTVIKQNDLPDNFWNSNLRNVMAFIGANGTGKSNILEFLYLAGNYRLPEEASFFLLFELETFDSSLQVSTSEKFPILISVVDENGREINMPPHISDYHSRHLKHDSHIGWQDFDTLLISNVFDGRNLGFDDDRNFTTNYLTYRSINKNNMTNNLNVYYQKEFRRNLLFVGAQNTFSKRNKFLPDEQAVVNHDYFLRFPDRIEVSFRTTTGLTQKRQELLNSADFYPNIIYNNIQSSFNDGEGQQFFYALFTFWIFLDEMLEIADEIISEKKLTPQEHISLFAEYAPWCRDIDSSFIGNFRKAEGKITEYFSQKSPYQKAKKKLLLIEIVKYRLLKEDNPMSFHVAKGRLHFDCKADIDLVRFFQEYVTLYEYPAGFLRFEWPQLSSGEYAFMTLFARIDSARRQIKKENLILMIDEGDLYFHPQMQKEFFYRLNQYVKESFQSFQGNIQLLLSSHSPIIVSDLPRSCVTLLYLNDKKVEIYKPDKLEQTFGANIHQLYTEDFFLQGGLMGRFAKDKLNELIGLLQPEKSPKEEDANLTPKKYSDAEKINYRKLINLIGEPVIREKLEELWLEKFPEEIDPEIKRLQRRIDELKNKIPNDQNPKTQE